MDRRWIAVAVAAALALGACARSPEGSLTPSSPTASAPAAPSGAITLPAASPLALPDAASLPFPARRDLPIFAPPASTPEATIQAFLDLVHDPGLTYHVDAAGHWVANGSTLTEARSIDHVGTDRFMRSAGPTGPESTAIVRGTEAVARQGDGPWGPAPATFVRAIDDLSSAIVIGDLGPDPAGGFSLVIDAGFDSFPRAVSDVRGNPRRLTTVRVDDRGVPLDLVFHQWWEPGIVGEDDAEGVVEFTFRDVGAPIAIPAIREGQAEPGIGQAPPPDPVIGTTVPGGGFQVSMPAGANRTTRELTYYDAANTASGLDLTALTVEGVSGLRYEVASVEVPAAIREGATARDLLKGIRHDIPSRTPSGDMLGYRYLDMAGAPGQEIVSDGDYAPSKGGLFRIRTVFVDGRLIVMLVSGPPDLVGSTSADRFLTSLVPA